MKFFEWVKKKMNKVSSLDYGKIEMPQRGDSWQKIKKFAMEVNGYELKGSFAGAADLANRSKLDELSLSDLHMVLFFEYRRFNHFGYEPDQDAMEHIYDIVDIMNQKQKSQQDGSLNSRQRRS